MRSLSIRGFKSFANKTSFMFEPGTSVIVGPNGSGKSNITDAILWVFGEQSARILRGKSMEDVIFAGSAGRSALGTAQVSIKLDNSDGLIPIDFAEVTISRRLFRSGDCEYRINDTPCRLIDIQEMLSDTGLGREMYSVVSQGRLDEVLDSKPADRRRLLEEAAGVLKHKRRKERALRKLKSMETNLSRGKDLLREINRQLGPLQKQADQAGRYDKLTKEIKTARVAGAVAKLRQLRKDWDSTSKETEEKRKTAASLNEQIGKAQAGVAELEKEIDEKGFLSGDIGEYRRQLEGLSERINSGLLLLEEKGKNLIAKLSEFRQTIHQYDSRAKEQVNEFDRLTKEKTELEAEVAKNYQELAEVRREAETTKKGSKQGLDEVGLIRDSLEAARSGEAKLDQEISRFLSQAESAKAELLYLEDQLAAGAKKISIEEKERIVFSKEKSQLSAKMPKLVNIKNQLKLEIDKAKELKATTTEAFDKRTDEARELRVMISALDSLRERPLVDISWLKENKHKITGFVGRAADVITTEKKYERAIEVALGIDINALVIADPDEAKAVYQKIEDSSEQPLRLMTSGRPSRLPDALPGLTRALDVVDAPESSRKAISGLLSNVWITDDMSSFLSAGSEVPENSVVVDLKGGYYDSRGLIAKQPKSTDSVGPLRTKREHSELVAKEKSINRDLKKLEKEISSANEGLKVQEEQAAEIGTTIQKIEAAEMTVCLKLESLEKEISRLRGEHADMSGRINEKQKYQKDTKTKLSELRDLREAKSLEIAEYDSELLLRKESLDQKRDKEQSVHTRLSETKVLMASLTERQTHMKSRLLSVGDNIEQLRKRLTHEKRIAAATEELRLRIQPVHDLYTELRLSAENWAKKLEVIAETEQAEGVSMRKDLRALHQKLRDITDDHSSLQQEIKVKDVEKAQVETEVGQITKYIVEDLEMALETALAQKDDGVKPEEWRLREEKMKEEIDKIGPVNQIAAEQFGKIEERQVFLTKQIEDLDRSQKALHKVMTVIDKKMQARFQITFEEVNVNFNKVFGQLFDGGSAELVFVDGEQEKDEQGIDIVAQPYGKRIQSLNLLSGGEKSLVGLAFLFALHHTRPSPFYILDEVEAALDDANLGRFVKLLAGLKERTQFLIITHQRRTMEAADCVFGVTMQADGVSKVISQKLLLEETIDERQTEAELVATTIGEPEQVPS